MGLLLCLREAVLNADQHGCEGRSGQKIFLSLEVQEDKRAVKGRVSDPGCGHDAALAEARADPQRGMHLGLLLIKGMADAVRYRDGGATVEFEFNC